MRKLFFSIRPLAFSALAMSSACKAEQLVKLNRDAVRVRTGPSLNAGEVATLPAGTKLAVLSEQNGWFKVRTQGRTGYLFAALTPACDINGAPVRVPGQAWGHGAQLSLREPLRDKPRNGQIIATLEVDNPKVYRLEDLARASSDILGYTRVMLPSGVTGYIRNVMVERAPCN